MCPRTDVGIPNVAFPTSARLLVSYQLPIFEGVSSVPSAPIIDRTSAQTEICTAAQHAHFRAWSPRKAGFSLEGLTVCSSRGGRELFLSRRIVEATSAVRRKLTRRESPGP
jgi:hypothetical protein